MLVLKKVSSQVYASVLEENKNLRYYPNQMASFGRLKENEGNKVEYLLFEKEGKVLASALLVHYQVKKIFSWVNCIFGPTFFEKDVLLFEEVLKKMKNYLFSSWKVLAFRVNPLLDLNLYRDVEKSEENVSKDFVKILENLQFQRMEKEWYEDPSIHLRCVYNKNIASFTLEELLKSLDQSMKRKIKKAKELKVKIEFLSKEKLFVFYQMFQAMIDRKETIASLRKDQIEALYDAFGEKIFFPAAYITKEDFEHYEQEQKIKIEKQKKKILLEKEKNLKENIQLLEKETENLEKKLFSMKKSFDASLEKDGKVYLSASCFLSSGKDFIFYMGGGKKELMDFQGTYAIHLAMLEKAKSEGFENYNLYGCSDRLNEEDADYGILKFKRQFKGDFEEYVGTYICKKKIASFLGL